MFKNGDLLFLSNFVEVIHVELADEGGKFAVLEIFGEYLLHKLLLVLDDEAVAFIRPLHNVAIPFILTHERVT